MQEQFYRVAVEQPLTKPQPWHRKFKAFEVRSWIPLPAAVYVDDSRAAVYDYWNPNIVSRKDDTHFYPCYESLTVLFLQEHRRVRGHFFVNFGNVKAWHHCCSQFIRAAVLSAADAVVIIHKVRESKPVTSPDHRVYKQSIKRAADSFAVSVLDYILMGDAAFHSVLDSDYSRSVRRLGVGPNGKGLL